MEKIDFIDVVDIIVKAGDGGNGAVTFRREKYIPYGGPDGGDGGDGGFVFLIADPTLSTLYHLTEKKRYIAQNGENGRKKKQSGRNGNDMVLRVPIGTIVRDFETRELIADLDEPGKYCCVARGGKGGRGNTHFKSPTTQAPKFAEQGAKGEERIIRLELKLLADAGLIGYPNVGKSSIISRISNARPKVADYHFTTLVPSLGVVSVDSALNTSFVIADVPGLIKGASQGKGLGNIFLKHVERCEVIVHVLDISGSEGRDPLQDYFDIREELEFFNKELANKPEIIVGNKADLLDQGELERVKSRLEGKLARSLMPVSAVTGTGLNELKHVIWDIIRESKKLFSGTLDLSTIEFEKPEPIRITMPDRVDIRIIRNDRGEFEIVSEYIRKYIEKYRMDAKYLLDDILEILQKNGLDEKLRQAGAKDGDTAWLEGIEFTFKE
ncbi:MAG TPA: GTPase ObgE [Fervidobacterium sp.]|nr:GTPase ObgE [Fervidobacterium sp.]HOQ40057.1 GTPase ObgE [Fervidobacterium sp.]HPT53407.1 GTPase ObgE [Fervidobacterium sp.]HPZ16856.1 GTPase ObgE [Fervidobacterium sp.]HQE47853.1 GTPase ObgE [Fervidobacterium sp.]